jgi:hypothetical protein
LTLYYPQCRINLSAVFDGFGGRDQPVTMTDIIPYSANLHLNSYKEADTWEVSFDSKAFPFSPELLRSVAVEVYVYQTPDQVSPYVWNAPEHLLATGLVDSAVITQDENGGIVSLSGRDYTSLLIDRQWDPTESGQRGRVPDGDLDKIVQQLVDEAVNADEIGRTLTVKFLDFEVAPQTSKVAKTVTRKKVTIKPPTTSKSRSSRKKRGVAVKSDSTYWDVIYKLCLSYGFIVYVRGFEVVIAKPHVLQAESENFYRVAYGRNLLSLEVERKLAKDAVPQIRVRSYDPVSKQAIEGSFPEGREQVVTGVGTRKEEYRVFTVPDVSDESTLKEIARSTYYTLARGEGTIRFSTPHLRDLENADLLRMRAGDAVQIVWDAFNSEVMLDSKISREQKISILLALGYSSQVAALVAEQYTKLDYFRQPFYVKNVNVTWDLDQGISFDVEAMNFINPARDGAVSI